MDHGEEPVKCPMNFAQRHSCFTLTSQPLRIKSTKNMISCMAFDNEAKFLAVGEFDGSIRLYSPITGKL